MKKQWGIAFLDLLSRFLTISATHIHQNIYQRCYNFLRIEQLAKVYSKSIFSGSYFFSIQWRFSTLHYFCSRTLYTVTTMNTKCICKNDVEFCRKQDNQFESTIPKISVNVTVTEAPFFTFWLRRLLIPFSLLYFWRGWWYSEVFLLN